MASAVFGDFLAAANQHLDRAVMVDDVPDAQLPAVIRGLYRMVNVMSRLCDDLAPCDEVEATSRDDLRSWEHAAVDVGAALRVAADCLRRGADEAAPDQAPSRTARLLEAAATELTAGRDLLQTHRTTDAAGLTDDRSEWAPVVTSLPITSALVNQIARWSRQLVPFTTQLASTARWHAKPRETGQVLVSGLRAELRDASQWLQAAGAAVSPALEIDPLRARDAELLQAIPAAMVPARQRPGTSAETVPELCSGISISARRLRSAMYGEKERARWSSTVSSSGWQWMAQAAAVTSHLSEQLLRALATGASKHSSSPLEEAQLDAAADLMIGMRTAWQEAGSIWDSIMTEGKVSPTAAAADAADLVLRIGRLTWDDPHWTPAHSRRAPPKPPSVLAAGADAVKAVIAAVHQAVDAMAFVAQADGDAVESAAAAGRLYVLTRSLPARADVPRRFAHAPLIRLQALRKTYDIALDASCRAAEALDELAIASGAPSRVLAFARAAALVQSNRRGSRSRPDADVPRDPLPFYWLFSNAGASAGRTGPLEQTIRDRGISDPIVLLRAVAIDNAAARLIAEAGKRAPTAATRKTKDNGHHAPGREVQVAAQSFPHGGIPARPTSRQSSRAEAEPGSPAHRVPGRLQQSRPTSPSR